MRPPGRSRACSATSAMRWKIELPRTGHQSRTSRVTPWSQRNEGEASMRGKVLSYSDLDGIGLISGDDGVRYDFVRGGLQGGRRTISAGSDVDFQIDGTRAINIYVVGAAATGQVGDKNKIAAALLAF